MVRRRGVVYWTAGVLVGLFLLFPGLSEAKKKEENDKSSVADALAQKAAREKAAVSRLNETEWEIQISNLSGTPPKKTVPDTLRFEKGRVTSQWLADAGYMPSNYTLTAGEDGSVVWETMQTKEGEGVAFWRGELDGEAVRGILSKHPEKGDALDYSFSGKMLGKITSPPPEDTHKRP